MSNYRQRLKKEIDLPSGERITIEKLNAFNAPFIEKRATEDDGQNGIRLSRFILTQKVGPLDGMKIVETVTDSKTEIGIQEIEQADVDCIVDAVLEFSGLTKRGQEARKTFPETATNGSACPPSREALSGAPADGPVAIANG